jgi:hypothetical protein
VADEYVEFGLEPQRWLKSFHILESANFGCHLQGASLTG